MAGSDGLTWNVSSATVNIGETIVVSVSYYGMQPTASGITGAFNGLATAALSSSGVEITGAAAGTVTVPAGTDVGNFVTTTNAFTLTVTAPVDDDEFLNKRGLTHFWENIDDLKQDKLTAGDNISITSNTISADTGMVYLGATVLTATADRISFTASTTYSNYKILAGAVLATGSGTWLDVRMLNGSSTILNTHQVQRVDGTTWGSAVWSGVSYLINSLGVNQYDGIDAEVDIYGGGSFWKKFHAYLGKAQGSSIITNISNGRNNSATAPNTFMLITGGTFSVGSWIKVWGWNN